MFEIVRRISSIYVNTCIELQIEFAVRICSMRAARIWMREMERKQSTSMFYIMYIEPRILDYDRPKYVDNVYLIVPRFKRSFAFQT